MTMTQSEIIALWPYLVGYLVFVLLAGWPIKWVLKDMWTDLVQQPQDPKSSNIDYAGKVGFIERSLYIGSILAGKPEFIGVWLVLKVAGRIWEKENVHRKDDTPAVSRDIFQVFLIGSALSMMYAVIGAKFIQSCLTENFLFAIFFATSLIPTTLIVKYYPEIPKEKIPHS